MSDKNEFKCDEPECDCGCKDGEECHCGEHEIEIVELEDENGDKEEYAILDEVDFKNRHFVIMAPLAEVQALHDAEDAGLEGDDEDAEIDLSIEIFEANDDNYTIVEDEELAKELMEYLDKLSHES